MGSTKIFALKSGGEIFYIQGLFYFLFYNMPECSLLHYVAVEISRNINISAVKRFCFVE